MESLGIMEVENGTDEMYLWLSESVQWKNSCKL
mgnify:CR=1 FL=1